MGSFDGRRSSNVSLSNNINIINIKLKVTSLFLNTFTAGQLNSHIPLNAGT
jgi:hypothetical protein